MIYLDHAAATPVSKKALQKMLPYFSDLFFNPSAAYLSAKNVRADFELAKAKIANFIGAKGNDLIITSGATEANALAFTSVDYENNKNFERGANFRKTNENDSSQNDFLQSSQCEKSILVLETEHASVLENAKKYSYNTIKVDKTGLIDLADLKQKLDDEVVLISVSLANNELGTIQPLSEVSQIIKNERIGRLERGITTPLFLHSDASQGLPLMDINVSRLGVDLLTLNSAKVSGPKGVGALFVGHEVKLCPQILGGGQERGLRSGTENIPGVMGFAAALEETKGSSAQLRKKYINLVENLKEELEKAKVKPIYLGNKKNRLANFLPICLPGLDAERLIFKLEEKEVYLSTGAACAASKGEPSHVLRAIGLSPEEIAGSLRISLGVLNDEKNISEAGKIIRNAIDEEYERINHA